MRTLIFMIVFTFVGCCAFAQMKTFTAKVTDSSGNAISNASVIVKGEKKGGGMTNDAGEFSITPSISGKSLLVSALGFQPREILIGIETYRIVTLYPIVKKLDEVVVVAYGTQKKRDVSSAIGILDSKDLKDIPAVSIDQSLQSRVAGINITQSSMPGGQSNINIRGINSISSNGQPLFVIDGFPMNTGSTPSLFSGGQDPNPLGGINPSDIASFTVLKDAAATSLYGSRAANGVILITTKRGQKQNTRLNFGASYGIQNVAKKLSLLNSQEYVKLVQETMSNAGIPKPSMLGLVGLDNDPTTYTSTTNWQDYLFRTAPVQNYDLSLTGGGEKTRFRVSGNYTNQQGTLIASGYKRYGFRLNLDNNITSKLNISTGISASSEDYKRTTGNLTLGSLQDALLISPTAKAYNPDGSYGTDPNGGRSAVINPLVEAYDPLNKTGIANILGNLTVNYLFSPSMSFKSVTGANYANARSDQFSPTSTIAGGFLNGYANISSSNTLNLSSDNSINFHKNINRHIIDITAGYSVNKRSQNSISAASSNFPDNSITSLGAGAIKQFMASRRIESGNIGMFASANYIFNNKYEITASVRRDGSSVFGSDRRWGNFPSISAGWKLSEENFLKGNSLINFLKIRGSWGLTGNQDLTGVYNAAMNLYNTKTPTGINVSYLNSPGLSLYQLGNPDVGWEESEQTNMGVDAQFFNGIINITADYFIRRNNSVLLKRSLPGSTGFTDVYQNIGSLQNKGVELSIQKIAKVSKYFSWNSAFNITFAKNKVTKLDLPPFRGDISGFLRNNDPSWVQEGYALGSFKGFKVKGIFQSPADIANAPVQSPGTKPGDIQFEDVNHDGVIDSKDQVILGNASPDFSGGFTNRFRYKALEATVVLNYSYGNKVYNGTRLFTEGMSGSVNQTSGAANRWTPNNTNTTIPRAVFGDPNQNSRISDRWIEDGSYMRLKAITLTYHLPVSLVKRLRLSSAECFISAENIFTLTKYTGYDPEVNSPAIMSNTVQGVDVYNAPLSRNFRLGLNISLW